MSTSQSQVRCLFMYMVPHMMILKMKRKNDYHHKGSKINTLYNRKQTLLMSGK